MFAGRMEYMTLAKPVTRTDRLGYKSSSLLEEVEDIAVYITRVSYNRYQQNELDVREYELTGYTYDDRPRVGWVIAGLYLIKDIRKVRNCYVLSLSTLGNSADEMVVQEMNVEGGQNMEWTDVPLPQ